MYETIRNFSFYRELWAYRTFMVSLIMMATCVTMGDQYRSTLPGTATTICSLGLLILSSVYSFLLHWKPYRDERYEKVLRTMAHDWKIRSWGLLGLIFVQAVLLCVYAIWLDRNFGPNASFSPLATFSGNVLFFCIFYDGRGKR